MEIVRYKNEFAEGILSVFYRAVHAVDTALYTDAEKEEWAPLNPDRERWYKKLELTRPFVAVENGRPAGFIELEDSGHIDCFYVDPEFQNRGIGLLLYSCAESEAVRIFLPLLYVEASKAAKFFFIKRNFKVVKENRILRNNQTLINYSMKKNLIA